MENPVKLDDLGVPLFQETSICPWRQGGACEHTDSKMRKWNAAEVTYISEVPKYHDQVPLGLKPPWHPIEILAMFTCLNYIHQPQELIRHFVARFLPLPWLPFPCSSHLFARHRSFRWRFSTRRRVAAVSSCWRISSSSFAVCCPIKLLFTSWALPQIAILTSLIHADDRVGSETRSCQNNFIDNWWLPEIGVPPNRPF